MSVGSCGGYDSDGADPMDGYDNNSRSSTPGWIVHETLSPEGVARKIRIDELNSELKTTDSEIQDISKEILEKHSIPKEQFSKFTPHPWKKDVVTITYKEPSWFSYLGFGKKHELEVSVDSNHAEKLESYRDIQELSRK